MAELHCSDGKVIKISKETEKEFRKAFFGGVWEFGDVIEVGSNKRIVLYNQNGDLVGVWTDRENDADNGRGQSLEYCSNYGYKKTGNIFKDNNYGK